MCLKMAYDWADGLTKAADSLTKPAYGLPNQVDSLTDQVDGLTDQVGGLTDQVDGLTDEVDDLTDEVDGLNTTAHSVSERNIHSYQNVFYFRARELNGHQNDSILDDIWVLLFSKDLHLSKDKFLTYVETHQDNLLFIIDGYDELAEPAERLTDLVSGRYLSNVTVIVTSRPGYGPELLKHYDSLFVIAGYDNDAKQDLIMKFSGAVERDLSSLTQLVVQDTILCELCQNPLNLFLCCMLSSEEDIPMPENKTDLFSHLVDFSMEKFCREDGIDDILSADLQRRLCLAAFDSLSLRRHYIAAKQINVKQNIDHLGFLRKEICITHFKEVTSYVFTHKSFQEFLAARHLASLCEDDRDEMVKLVRHFLGQKRFWMVTVFLAGMLTNREDLEVLIGCINHAHYESAMAFRRLGHLDLCENHDHHLLLHVINEINPSLLQEIHLVNIPHKQLAFTNPWCSSACSQGFSKLCELITLGTVTLTHRLCVILSGYAVKPHSPKLIGAIRAVNKKGLLEYVAFHNISDADHFRAVMPYFNLTGEVFIKFLGIVFEKSDIESPCVLQASHLKVLEVIDCLNTDVLELLLEKLTGSEVTQISLIHCDLNDLCCKLLARVIYSTSSLTKFEFLWNIVEISNAEPMLDVFRALSEKTCLVHFSLSHMSSRVEGAIFPRMDDVSFKVIPHISKIIHNNTLSKIRFSNSELGPSLFSLLNVVVSSQHLESLTISDCYIFGDGLGHIIDTCRYGNITELRLAGSDLTIQHYELLREFLRLSTKLKSFSSSPNGKHSFQCLAEGLLECPHLETLKLFNTTLTMEGIQVFCMFLETSQNLKTLTISPRSHHLLTNDEITPLLAAFGKCESLAKLTLKQIGVSDNHIRGVFGDVISCHDNLRWVDLSQNLVTRSAVTPLCNALQKRKHKLNYLSLVDCPVTDYSDVDILRRLVLSLKISWF